MQRLGALPAGVLAGALFGALVGGVLGRVLMRVIFLIDKSNDGAETEFGTVGEITVGGTLTLLVLSSITGVMGGIFYIGIRRWLPWPSPVARGTFFGLLMMFGPGLLFLGDVDLQIFEPALVIFPAFVASKVTLPVLAIVIFAGAMWNSISLTWTVWPPAAGAGFAAGCFFGPPPPPHPASATTRRAIGASRFTSPPTDESPPRILTPAGCSG